MVGVTGQQWIAYSFQATETIFYIFRGPCLPISLFVFPTGQLRLNIIRYLCHSMPAVGSVAQGECPSLADWSHLPKFLFPDQGIGTICIHNHVIGRSYSWYERIGQHFIRHQF
jgi:hypothetical protein